MMMARHPLTNKKYYFVDKCLPFGSSILCAHFQRVSDVIKHINAKRSKSQANNYLDDFLFTALMQAVCDGNVQLFLDICEMINFRVAMEKNSVGHQGHCFPRNVD